MRYSKLAVAKCRRARKEGQDEEAEGAEDRAVAVLRETENRLCPLKSL